VEIKNMINKFDFAGTPEIIFGAGKIRGITDIILKYGSRVILLTGSRSLSIFFERDKRRANTREY
jgi:alcohol dehydrogenase YqhD (iron-dependent ADH family)